MQEGVGAWVLGWQGPPPEPGVQEQRTGALGPERAGLGPSLQNSHVT